MARHVFLCPLRWADMDSLGHVNNVRFVDYLQESRVDMLRVHAPATGGEQLAEGTVVVRHEVEFRAPLVFRPTPVRIEAWVTRIRAASFTMAYEILEELPTGERRVFVRASTLLTPYLFDAGRPRRIREEERTVLERFLEPDPGGAERLVAAGGDQRTPEPTVHHYTCHVRFSDVDVYGHVNNVMYFEYFQEARIAFLGSLGDLAPEDSTSVDSSMGQVVAHVDVSYKRPMLFRPETYDVATWVTAVGTTSYALGCRITDETGTVYATGQVRMVAFDASTQRSRPLGAGERDRLEHARTGV